MTPRKKAESLAATPQAEPELQAWALDDLKGIIESLESAEQTLQGQSDLGSVDIVLTYEGRRMMAHHDGMRWWVTFGG